MSETTVYSDMLEEKFTNYEGEFQNLLRNIPIFFNLLQKIYRSKKLKLEARLKINACFSYFAIPNDVIPDYDGPVGFLDDLFICAYVLNNLTDDYSDLIEKNSPSGVDMKEEIRKTLQETQSQLKYYASSILGFSGLLKIEDLAKEMVFQDKPGNIHEKIWRLQNQVLDLTGLLRTILISEGQKPERYKLSKIKLLFSNKEWSKVLRILENAELSETKYDASHEQELDRIRRKVLLELDEDLLDD